MIKNSKLNQKIVGIIDVTVVKTIHTLFGDNLEFLVIRITVYSVDQFWTISSFRSWS